MQTFGQYLVNQALPKDLQTTEQLDKKEIHKRLRTLAQRDTQEAAEAIDKIRKTGHELATLEGMSIGLDDITPNYRERDQVIKPILQKIKTTDDPKKRIKMLEEAQGKLLEQAKTFHGTQGELVRSGARGKPTQLMRSFITPVSARMPDGGMYPWLITKSHSEGLNPADYFVTNMETRNNQISSYISVTEPGDLAKVMVNNMGDQLVLTEDCGTENGVPMRASDPNILDRFTAKRSPVMPNTLITPQVANRMKGKGQVLVRSPMTCELGDGVCQKCFGNNERGALPHLGSNIGIRSAQAITEPLTQMQLSAKHGVRQGGMDKKTLAGLQGVRNVLEFPKSFQSKATLADTSGGVSKVKRAPQGGFVITVANRDHYIPAGMRPLVRPGDKVQPGDALSDGVPMPNEVVKYKGMGDGRRYLVNRLHDLYSDQGMDIDKRHFEILSKTNINRVQVEEDPKDEFYPGEVVHYSAMTERLARDSKEVDPNKAIGKTLAKATLDQMAGVAVTKTMAQNFSKFGLKTIPVTDTAPKITPIMAPATRNPLLNPDWMARLGHRYIRDSILEGAQYGHSSDVHGTHPVPAYMFGEEFGEGRGGRY